jgi:hypothetical protein
MNLIKNGRISFLKFIAGKIIQVKVKIVSNKNDVDNFFDIFKFKIRFLFEKLLMR